MTWRSIADVADGGRWDRGQPRLFRCVWILSCGLLSRHEPAPRTQYKSEGGIGMYDNWLLDVRSELQRQCLDLCGLICETRARRSEPAGALEAACCRIQLQPLEDTGYHILMELQADLGDRAGAVSTCHRCASVHPPRPVTHRRRRPRPARQLTQVAAVLRLRHGRIAAKPVRAPCTNQDHFQYTFWYVFAP